VSYWQSYPYDNQVEAEALKGKDIVSVDGLQQYSDAVKLHFGDGTMAVFYHEQDCCENVQLEDFNVTGELVGPIYNAYESSDRKETNDYGDGETWTFYKVETMRGSLFMRWVGSSNGYYSEAVDIVLVKDED
jgi:hypothetical protein